MKEKDFKLMALKFVYPENFTYLCQSNFKNKKHAKQRSIYIKSG